VLGAKFLVRCGSINEFSFSVHVDYAETKITADNPSVARDSLINLMLGQNLNQGQPIDSHADRDMSKNKDLTPRHPIEDHWF
jgi:hypothetical protein